MELLYKKLCTLKNTLILKKFQNIAKNFQKNLRICKKNLHRFFLFEVLYNWLKFRRLKMGDPVYTRITDRRENKKIPTDVSFVRVG